MFLLLICFSPSLYSFYDTPLRSINVTNTDTSSTPVSGESSTIEGDIRSQSEADQSMSLTQSEDQSNRYIFPEMIPSLFVCSVFAKKRVEG